MIQLLAEAKPTPMWVFAMLIGGVALVLVGIVMLAKKKKPQ